MAATRSTRRRQRLVVAVADLDHRDPHVSLTLPGARRVPSRPPARRERARPARCGAALGQLCVVGLELGIPVAVGLAVPAPGLGAVGARTTATATIMASTRVGASPTPQAIAPGPLLVGERVGAPRQVELAKKSGPAASVLPVMATPKKAWKAIVANRMTMSSSGDHRWRPGVDADEHPHEQVPREQEVDHHRDVPGVGAQGQLEQRRVVEDRQAEEEQGGRHDGVGEHAAGSASAPACSITSRGPQVLSGRDGSARSASVSGAAGTRSRGTIIATTMCMTMCAREQHPARRRPAPPQVAQTNTAQPSTQQHDAQPPASVAPTAQPHHAGDVEPAVITTARPSQSQSRRHVVNQAAAVSGPGAG